MTSVAEDEPPSIEELLPYQRGDRVWIRSDGNDSPVAYLFADEVDDCAHVEQVTVHPDWRTGGSASASSTTPD